MLTHCTLHAKQITYSSAYKSLKNRWKLLWILYRCVFISVSSCTVVMHFLQLYLCAQPSNELLFFWTAETIWRMFTWLKHSHTYTQTHTQKHVRLADLSVCSENFHKSLYLMICWWRSQDKMCFFPASVFNTTTDREGPQIAVAQLCAHRWAKRMPEFLHQHRHSSSPERWPAAAAGAAGDEWPLLSEDEPETHTLCPVESEYKHTHTHTHTGTWMTIIYSVMWKSH